MELAKYKAVLCEGSAEEAIMDILLDNSCLIFEKDELIDERVLRVRSAKNFEDNYLRKGFNSKISVIRVLDSHNENFRLSVAYRDKVDVINIVTAPEIEMLIIINANKYDEYRRSNKMPSNYCRENLRMRNVKSYEFVSNYFSNPLDLVLSIKRYCEVTKRRREEYNLFDLINSDYRNL